MLGSFIRHGMTLDECRNEATFMIAAGSDTTSSVIRCTMLHLMTNPRAYQTLKSTVKEAVRNGKVSSPITQAEGMALPYLRVGCPDS
jgi:cytochrome P450